MVEYQEQGIEIGVAPEGEYSINADGLVPSNVEDVEEPDANLEVLDIPSPTGSAATTSNIPTIGKPGSKLEDLEASSLPGSSSTATTTTTTTPTVSKSSIGVTPSVVQTSSYLDSLRDHRQQTLREQRENGKNCQKVCASVLSTLLVLWFLIRLILVLSR